MAWDPCVSCGRAFHGSTAFTYVTWHQGEARFSFRLRQCDACAADFRTGISGTADKREEDGSWSRLFMAEASRAAPTTGLPKNPELDGVRSDACGRPRQNGKRP